MATKYMNVVIYKKIGHVFNDGEGKKRVNSYTGLRDQLLYLWPRIFFFLILLEFP